MSEFKKVTMQSGTPIADFLKEIRDNVWGKMPESSIGTEKQKNIGSLAELDKFFKNNEQYITAYNLADYDGTQVVAGIFVEGGMRNGEGECNPVCLAPYVCSEELKCVRG